MAEVLDPIPVEVPVEKTYLVSIRIPFKAIDDVGARLEFEKVKTDPLSYFSKLGTQVKLQKIEQGKPPIGLL